MLKQLKTSHFNADDQDANNTSGSDPSDNNSGQSSFDSSNPFGGDTLSWGPRPFYVDAGSQSHLNWGAGFQPSPAVASGNSSASSPSAASWSSSGASTAASSVSSAASVTSGGSFSGGSTIVSTPGSRLVFDNTYDPNL
jgi:hypothetical protein